MLYLIRHGQTDWNLGNKIQGQYDVPLNDTGRIQANDMAKKLEHFHPERIISSDLSRAATTAQIIGNILDVRVDYDTRLREYDFGLLTGWSRRAIDTQIMELFFSNPKKYNAETFEHAFERIGEFLCSVDFNRNSLVVTHGGVINFIMCYLEDKNKIHGYQFLDKCMHVHIDNSSVLRLKNLESHISILKNQRFYKYQKSK